MPISQRPFNATQPQRFHIVLSFLGLTLGVQYLVEMSNSFAPLLMALLVFSLLLFSVVASVFVVKFLVNYQSEFKRFKYHKQGHYSAFSMSLLLTGLLLQPYLYELAWALWSIGSVLQFIITAYVIKNWLYQEHWEMVDMSPVWFLPISGILLIPLGIPEFAPLELGWMLLSIGLVFWLVLFSLMLYRLFFLPLLSEQQALSLFSLASPPALAFLSYVHINQMDSVDLIARLFFYTSLFFSLLLLSQVRRFITTPFCEDWWRIPFPFALMGLANLTMFELLTLPLYGYIAALFLSLTSVLVLHLSLKTLLTYKSSKT